MSLRPTMLSVCGALLAFSCCPCWAEQPLTAAEVISKFDADGDGKLNQAEVSRALASGEGEPENEADERKFLRVSRDEKGQADTLETSVTSYKSKDLRNNLVVDLVGAVHVGDAGYYQKLNELFKTYDVVLYELVAPEGTVIPQGGRKSEHPVGRIQEGMKSILDLEFQLEKVDYTRRNFVHADMTPEQMAASMKERGESFLQMLFRMMGQATAQAQSKTGRGSGDVDILMALFAPDRSTRMKRIMADQFEDLDGAMSILEGPNGSTLITERNKKALQVLRREINRGHKRIGIFYGAGHMNDMAERLEDEFNMEFAREKWLVAWDMRAKSKKAKPIFGK